jgi:hypothetical protein
MKSLFAIAFLLISFASFSQRVLTEEERQQLLGSSIFSEKCQWAVRDYAAYWSIHDGAGLATESDRIKWAKDRQLSIAILKNDITDPHLVVRFLNASKGKQFTLGAAPQSTATIIAAWDSGNAFEEFVAQYFSVLGDDINFSIGN